MPIHLRIHLSCLSLLLAGCSNPDGEAAPANSPKQWIEHNHLEHSASSADVAVAKSSEVPFKNGQAELGGGLHLVLLLGDLIGSRSFSTTSYYNLVDARGRSLAKLPSRFHKSADNEGSKEETKVWISPSRCIVLVYESVSTGSGDMEFHGLIHRLEHGEWLAHGVDVPHWKEPEVVPEGVLVSPTFHDGPFVTGVIDGAIILLPVKNVYYSVEPEKLRITHPFPFSPG